MPLYWTLERLVNVGPPVTLDSTAAFAAEFPTDSKYRRPRFRATLAVVYVVESVESLPDVRFARAIRHGVAAPAAALISTAQDPHAADVIVALTATSVPTNHSVSSA